MAIRGKMRGRRFEDEQKASSKKLSVQTKHKRINSFHRKALANNPHPSVAMEDPCMQDMNSSSKFYLDYCELAKFLFDDGILRLAAS